MNIEKVFETIVEFISKRVKTAGKKGVVIGFSGGIDSAVTGALSTIALGRDNVHGLLMPFYRSRHFDDAMNIVHGIGVKYSTVWINRIYDSFYETGLLWKDSTKENLMSRIRMCLLYAYANEHNLLVAGTCNLTEIQTGYFTKYGDGGSDFEALGKNIKKEVYLLGRYFNAMDSVYMIPEDIFSKEPTAELHPDQKDQDDIGPYDIADRIVDKVFFGVGDISDIDIEAVNRVMNLINNSDHKRVIPYVPTLPNEPIVSHERFVTILKETMGNPNITDGQFRMIVQNTIKFVK